MSFGPQFPGSASVESKEPEVPEEEPTLVSGEDLCPSCQHAETCMIAISREFVRTASGDPDGAIQITRCAHYLPPMDAPTDVVD